MNGRARQIARRFRPAFRLRAILLAVLIFAALLPAIGAIFLRVYENALVRQTEAELIAQGAAIVAMAASSWPGAEPVGERWEKMKRFYQPEPPHIDLSTSPILPERPRARETDEAIGPNARKVVAKIAPAIVGTSRVTLASIKLLDAKGTVVIGFGDRGMSYAHLPEVQAALAGQTVTLLRRNGDFRSGFMQSLLSRASAVRVHHARPIRVGDRVVGVVMIARSPRSLLVGIEQDRDKLLIGVAITLALLLIMAALLSRAIARPIAALSAATDRVALGPVAIPDTPRTAALEIRALYDAFRVMAVRIERRSRYLRDFAAAVSHEFKTPIAGIRGAVELLDEHGWDMSEADRRRFLANVGEDADRLSHLVQRLLDLARADMAVTEHGLATALVDPVARAADAMRDAGMAIEVALESPVPVAVPGEVIEAVLATLLENSRQAGARAVRIIAAVEREGVRLSTCDDGSGVPPGDRERLFDPFFTSRREEGGTGLGLAIARSLLAASGATIAYREGEAGACFDLLLPRAG